MMEYFERFGLLINDQVVRTPVALASMAGIVDADYALARAAHIGVAFLGGYSIDDATIAASRTIAMAGRPEFLPEDPLGAIGTEIGKMKNSKLITGVNIRAASPESLVAAADLIGDGVVYEIDAHCRQDPMINAGSGEFLIRDPTRLIGMIHALKEKEVTVSVKVRAGVAPDDVALAKKIWKAGADILHIDLMDFGHARLKQIRNAVPLVLIANNSINTFDRMKEMFSHGADLVSLARKSDERTLAGLDAAISRYADETGWYNSPKQLCRGGDIRALTFCCMPVKSCPLIPTLDRLGLTRDEYITLKEQAVRGTVLEGGSQTCFGSLVWCCKSSSPCMFRDMTLSQTGISSKAYMQTKRQLSERIIQHLFLRERTV